MTTNSIPYDLLQPDNILNPLIFPDPSRIFADRSRRFTDLAREHYLGDWLSFLGKMTEAQHDLLQEYTPPGLPDEPALAFAWSHHLPPIAALSWPRHPSWQQVLTGLADRLLPHAPQASERILKQLQIMAPADMEALADRVLRMEFNGEGSEYLPFVAAALQVHWTAMAAGLKGRVKLLEATGTCPCCGFLPVAGIIRTDGEIARLRYLHCALCNTEWHLVRVTCAGCLDIEHITYHQIDGSDGAIRAETCDTCHGYLKNIYRETAPQADPVADDLATLALDLLVDEAGYGRMSPNLLFMPSGDVLI